MSYTMKKKENNTPSLIDIVFSWSLSDVMNKDLYCNKVNQIPNTFTSRDHYLRSFTNPLIEETHAALRSSIMAVRSAPVCEIFHVERSENFNPPKDLFYRLNPNTTQGMMYKPEVGDLIALTAVKPNWISDREYTVALVQVARNEDDGRIPILSSKRIFFENPVHLNRGKMGNKLFAVYLSNLTTNIRIWKALHPVEGAVSDIINSVLRINPSIEEKCSLCSNKKESIDQSNSHGLDQLDDSQKEAVLNCIALTECDHRNSVKLIWGPPGTGKTKTIASLLVCLLRMKCRTLTCAPTNVAVVGVANRLMSCLTGMFDHETYGLGDIILVGNGKRMKIDEHKDLYDVFLDHRITTLSRCFASSWKGCLDTMICFLEHPAFHYRQYLGQQYDKVQDDGHNLQQKDEDEDEDEDEENLHDFLNKLAIHEDDDGENLQQKDENEDEDEDDDKDLHNLLNKLVIHDTKENKKGDESKKKHPKAKREVKSPLTLEEFFAQKVKENGYNLEKCIVGLYTHMPTSHLPLEVVREMVKALQILQTIQSSSCMRNEDIKDALQLLKFLRDTFSVPHFVEHQEIRDFCLQNACIIFCTVSSSSILHTEGMTTSPFKLVIIDEAAQVKECESTIPLQLPGARHAILVGDEKQLPAMVTSKICEESLFGRSLFERLVTLGHNKHLLNVQYRMHPSISVFPNKTFYDNRLRDGPNVAAGDYHRTFLKGKLFGSYSFINVTDSQEDFGNGRSPKNIVEASVIAEILSKLYKESMKSDQRVRIGCISPYKSQVSAIQELLGSNYCSDSNEVFSVNVRSVDGFQGGEEDIIIISTVRCNVNGNVGFLNNLQRANVSLTRARYCLWILGNESTLSNSGSVWAQLVIDAKNRGCFYNAYEDKDLSLAISLTDLGQLNSLFTADSVLFKSSMWKVRFNHKFNDSMSRIHELEIKKEVVSLLGKLSNGYGHNDETELLKRSVIEEGSLSLIWTIEIVRDNETDIQAIKVLDIQPLSQISEQTNAFYLLFHKYTSKHKDRCLCRRIEGGVVIPMTWHVDADSSGEDTV